jgi:signal transduction histidine kinase
VAVTSIPEQTSRDDRFSRFVGRVSWLSRHRRGALLLIVASIAGALLLDIAFPSYPIAGFYLVPVTVAALTLRVRVTIAVSALCLALALYVMVVQDRTDGPTITVVCFCVLGGAGLIALAYLFKRVDSMYETERVTTARLESLAAQLQTLQEGVVLDPERSVADLLGHVTEQAGQLLGSDGCCLYRLDQDSGELTVAASAGAASPVGRRAIGDADSDPVARALGERRPVAVCAERGSGVARGHAATGGRPAEVAAGALLAVPLLVRDRPYGVLALSYREPRLFTDVDVRLAASFGGQAALAIENARLRAEVERNAVASERSRLARDLHDSVTQSLFAASLKAEAVRRRWEPPSEEARRNVEDVERLTRGALAEMRSLLLEMRPQTLADASLGVLLEHLVAAAEGRMLIDVELAVSGTRSLPPDVTVALYRIAQEAINNVERHSGATAAWVRLDASEEAVQLQVGDDGEGFDTGGKRPGHLGLDIMRERADAAGVRLAVDSASGRGTLVTAQWDGTRTEGDAG